MAVLPTPGSPISTGLFFVRRDSTWIVRLISASLPITGSSLPSFARAVRSIVNFFRLSKVSSAVSLSANLPERYFVTAWFNLVAFTPADFSNSEALLPQL